MTITTQRFTLDEYCAHNDGPDTVYELVNGELVAMTLGKGQHGEIADFLTTGFRTEIRRLDYPWVAKQMVIGIQSPRGDRWDTVRIPDVVVLPLEQWRAMKQREAIIQLNEPPPILVVEVVSKSTYVCWVSESAQRTAYRAKRAEYSVLEIPEYWIVDPLLEKVTVLVLTDGWYDATEFTGDAEVRSPTFPELALTADAILHGEV